MLAPEIFANSLDQFFSRQLSLRLYYCSLTMYPVRLNWIQPWTFDRQSQGQYSHSSFLLHSLVVLLDPSTHCLTFVPGGIVPNEHQHPLAFFTQLPANPLKEICRYQTDRAAIYES